MLQYVDRSFYVLVPNSSIHALLSSQDQLKKKIKTWFGGASGGNGLVSSNMLFKHSGHKFPQAHSKTHVENFKKMLPLSWFWNRMSNIGVMVRCPQNFGHIMYIIAGKLQYWSLREYTKNQQGIQP